MNSALETSRTPAWLNWARALLVIAMGVDGYLAWVSLSHGAAAGCGAESGCNAVLQSRWAYWLGLPVSVPALLLYLALLGSTVLLQKRPSADDQRGSWAAIIVLSVVIVGSAFWFVSLQVFVIQSFCKYCLTAHACGFAAAMLLLSNIPYAAAPGTPMWSPAPDKPGVPRGALALLIGVGLAGVAALAAGQMLVQKERNVVKLVAASATNVAASASSTNEDELASPNARLIAPRTLSLYNGKFILHLDELPMMGSPDATNLIVCLLDYTCIHCRALHPILTQVTQQYSNQFGIVCLPISLSPECNPFIPKANAHMDPSACAYARLGLAVWRAKPAAHLQFDDYLFTGNKPPPVDEAKAFAAKLVGADKLEAAMSDPWVSQQILTDCKLHRTNWVAVDDSAMPQIVMGNAISSGPINSLQHLQILLYRYMSLNLGLYPR
jgi:uncharacterized membrane protein/thiol-disulfide isomerase/thioredoxin